MSRTSKINRFMDRYLDKYIGGHITIGKLTIFGRNAMHYAWNYRRSDGMWVCFRPPSRCFGMRIGYSFYISPDGTPGSSIYYRPKKHWGLVEPDDPAYHKAVWMEKVMQHEGLRAFSSHSPEHFMKIIERTMEFSRSQKAQWDRDAEKRNQRLILEAHIEELEMTLKMKGKMLLHGQLIDAASVEDDPDVIHPSLLEVRLGALKAELTSLNKGEQ